MVVTAPRMTVSGAAPAIPKNTTEGTPRRLLANDRETMSGPAPFGRAMAGLQACELVAYRMPDRAWRPRGLTVGRLRGRSRPTSACSPRADAVRPAGNRRAGARWSARAGG